MIALFDSGYGGLTVLKEVMELLPEYDYLYFGDNARAPYGNRSRETITKFSEEAVEFLFSRDVKFILFACNTASGLALRHVQQKYLVEPKITDKKILGVIRPVVEKAAQISKSGRIGVVGTRGTISSKTYEIELKKINPSLKIFGQACPLIVPLVEENYHHTPEAHMILKKYLRPLKSYHIDTLILGCTHYPFMFQDFKRMMGKNVAVLHTGKIVAESLVDYLKRHPEIETQLSRNKKRHFLTTDDPERFKEFAHKFLGLSIPKVEKVQL